MANLPIYKRVLLKISGEALAGSHGYGIDSAMLSFVAGEIQSIVDHGIQLGLVAGGGNIFRGTGLTAAGMDRVTGDHIGMLATVINSLAIQEAIEKQGIEARVMSAVQINQMCEDYIRRRAIRHLEKNRVVIFAAGTGNPFFTTDSAASLKAVELNADILLKATKVDGVYSADPITHPEAIRYQHISYDEALEKKLKVMDATAIVMCRDNHLPLRVLNITEKGAILRLLCGTEVGTLVA